MIHSLRGQIRDVALDFPGRPRQQASDLLRSRNGFDQAVVRFSVKFEPAISHEGLSIGHSAFGI